MKTTRNTKKLKRGVLKNCYRPVYKTRLHMKKLRDSHQREIENHEISHGQYCSCIDSMFEQWYYETDHFLQLE